MKDARFEFRGVLPPSRCEVLHGQISSIRKEGLGEQCRTRDELSALLAKPTAGVLPASRAEGFQRLINKIAAGEPNFRPGKPLPSQVELGRSSGTSRPTTRIILSMAEERGLVRCQVDGIFVTMTAGASARLDPLPCEKKDPPTVEQMLTMRRDREGAAVEWAALKMRGSQKLYRRLEAVFKEFRAAVTAGLSYAALKKKRLLHWEIFRAAPAENSPGGAYDEAQVYVPQA